MTNGDKVRQMTNSDLEELWSAETFDDKYIPACGKDPDTTLRTCRYWNFACETCPATFRNWLDEEVEE